MKGTPEGSGKIGDDWALSDARVNEPPRWGLRTPYRMLTITIQYLERHGPADAPAIAGYLLHDSPVANTPNARRSTGLSSANQAIVTLRNLDLVERGRDLAFLNHRGKEFALVIGTHAERPTFRHIIFSNPGFRWFWGQIAGRRTLTRGELIDFARSVYPRYNPETRKTLVGVCLNYARAAGLISKEPGELRYTVSNHRTPALYEVGTPERHPGVDQVESEQLALDTSGPSARSHDPLREAARLLGWALADDPLDSNENLPQQIWEAFEAAKAWPSHLAQSSLIELAQHQARLALTRRDSELLRLTVRMVNVMLHAASGGGEPPH